MPVEQTTRTERVVFGEPAAATVAAEVGRLGKRRVFILASRTLRTTTDAVAKVVAALGSRCAGVIDGIPSHTPLDHVLRVAAAARAAAADVLVTIGGGSVTDCGNAALMALRHRLRTVADFAPLHIKGRLPAPPAFREPGALGAMRLIAVPTTCSAGEFTPFAGVTHPALRTKQQLFAGADIVAQVVVLDPAITVHTPQWLWLSTGLRAVDHCVEALCSIRANPHSDLSAKAALQTLCEGLRASKADPADLAARLRCQIGMWTAVSNIRRVPFGASHAIGHILGSVAGVPHGHTSCVLLPAVLEYNRAATAAQQREIAAAFGDRGVPASEHVRRLVRDLGCPSWLEDVGVDEGRHGEIAEKSMSDPWIPTNPRRITAAAQVREILRLASKPAGAVPRL